MSPTIEPGSLSFINKHIRYENIEENDVIAYTISTGDKVTHRVISITSDGFETKGDSNDLSDGVSVTQKNYIGKNVFSIPKLGYVIKIIQTQNGKIILIAVIILLLISGFLSDIKEKRNKKQEHTD